MKAYIDLVNTPIEIGDVIYSEYFRDTMVVVSGTIGIFDTKIKCYDGGSYHTIVCDDDNCFPVYVLPQYRAYNNDDIAKMIIPEECKKFKSAVPDNRFEIIEPIIAGLERLRKRGFRKDYIYYSTGKQSFAKSNGKCYYSDDIRVTICNDSIKISIKIYAYSANQNCIAYMKMGNTSLKILNDKTVNIINPIITGHDSALESKELLDRLFELVDDCEKS